MANVAARKAEDLVIATGKTYTVREFVERAFAHVGITIQWHGVGSNECGIDSITQKKIIIIDRNYFRPTEVDVLIGDASKAYRQLGWQPRVNFEGLIKLMMDHDYALVQEQLMSAQQVPFVHTQTHTYRWDHI